MTEPETPPPAPARPRSRRRLLFAGTFLLLCALYYSQWSTQPLRLADGREFAVLNFDRHVSFRVRPDGARDTVRYFWVRYYANASGAAGMVRDAKDLATALFPVAEQNGFNRLQLDQSRPVFLRHFPLAIISHSVRFERDSTGRWHEASF
jgi:hypothetical protein